MKSFKTLKDDLIENRSRIAEGFSALLGVDVLKLLIPRIVKHAIHDLTAGAVSSSGLLTNLSDSTLLKER